MQSWLSCAYVLCTKLWHHFCHQIGFNKSSKLIQSIWYTILMSCLPRSVFKPVLTNSWNHIFSKFHEPIIFSWNVLEAWNKVKNNCCTPYQLVLTSSSIIFHPGKLHYILCEYDTILPSVTQNSLSKINEMVMFGKQLLLWNFKMI